MTRVITKNGKQDLVKTSMLNHFIRSGYVVSIA